MASLNINNSLDNNNNNVDDSVDGVIPCTPIDSDDDDDDSDFPPPSGVPSSPPEKRQEEKEEEIPPTQIVPADDKKEKEEEEKEKESKEHVGIINAKGSITYNKVAAKKDTTKKERKSKYSPYFKLTIRNGDFNNTCKLDSSDVFDDVLTGDLYEEICTLVRERYRKSLEKSIFGDNKDDHPN